MASVFDIIKKINNKIELSEEEIANFDKIYNRYIVNRYFSMFPDTVDAVYELTRMETQYHDMSNFQHYIYLNNIVPKRNRFEKWGKVIESEAVELLKQVYRYSTKTAIEVAKVLSEDDLDILRSKVEKGGVI